MRKTWAWLIAVGVAIGCQTSSTSLNPSAAPPDETQTISIKRMLQLAGFCKSNEASMSLLPQEVSQLAEVAHTIVLRASELNINDPPEVTRQKAEGILESLHPWDSTLAAVRSVGLVNDETAHLLNAYVGQLRAEAQKLVQYLPTPQAIASVQQLATSLHATIGPLAAIRETTPE